MLKSSVQLSLLRQLSWSSYLIPTNGSIAGISTILAVCILELGGTVKEVAIAIFLSGLTMTLGSILWGKVLDRVRSRMVVIVISSLSLAILAASMYFATTVSQLLTISAMAGLATAGLGPVTNMLVMQRSGKEQWLSTNSWTSLFTCAGIVMGMVTGYLWLMAFDSRSYALLCSAISATGALLAFRFTRDLAGARPSLTAQYNAVSALEMLKHLYTFSALHVWNFVRLPQRLVSCRQSLSSSAAGISSQTSKQLLFFAGIAAYFMSGNLFFTPYIPFLKENGISDSEVFLAYTVLHLSKVVFLPFNSRFTALAGGEQKMARWSYVPRVSGIMAILIAAIFIAENPGSILVITLAAFVAIDVGFILWSTTTTSFLMRTLATGKEGNILGINSGATGMGLLIGSIVAGEITSLFGYSAVFVLATAALCISFFLIAMSLNRHAIKVDAVIPAKQSHP